jgi:hypothetical protein
MRFGVIPTALGERIAALLGKLPYPIVDTLVAINQARALMNLVKCGALETLRDGPKDSAAIAAETKTNAEALHMLLRIGESGGYVKRSGSAWQLTSRGRKQLLRGAEMDLTGTVLFKFYEWELVEHMDEVLYTGIGKDFHHTLTDPDFWAAYQRSMTELASLAAPHVAKLVPVRSGATSLLDVAGSHGIFGAAICRLHPGMRSTVLDLPAAIPHARALAKEKGIHDVVTHIEGDMAAGNYPADQDVVFFGNIMHHFSPEQNVQILRHAHGCLNSDGTAAIWDIEHTPENAPAEVAGDTLALYFRIISTSSTFTAEEYRSWMGRAGFRDVQTRRHPLQPRFVLTTGRK